MTSSVPQPDPLMPVVPSPRVLRTRRAPAYGVSKGQLAGPRWRSTWRGVHAPTTVDALSPLQRILEAAALIPQDAAVGGWAAAYLLGATDLDGRGPGGVDQLPVPLVVPPPRRIRRRPGLLLVRSALPAGEVSEVHGVPVTTPVRTAFDCARMSTLREAVVALDCLGRQAGVRQGDVADLVLARRGWRGVEVVRRAVTLADPRAASCGESRYRVLWTVAAGLPPPEVNAPVCHVSGHLLGIADLLDPDAGLVGEYDGASHRDEAAHVHDNAREEWMEDAGLIVVRAGSRDLWRYELRTVERLRAARRRGLTRDRRRDAWTWAVSALPDDPPASPRVSPPDSPQAQSARRR